MKEHDLKELGEDILREVRSDVTPKKLMAAVRKAHPEASKKEIIRAAFYALIAHADESPEELVPLHKFALEHRAPDEELH
jgi:hypothetical protein